MSPPGHSRGGPLTTDRPTAENPGEKFEANGTPVPRQAATRRAVPVRGVLELDLSRHVDTCGGVYDDGRIAAYRVLTACPAGVAVRIRIGRASYFYPAVLDALAQLLEDVGSVEIVGVDDRGIAAMTTGLRERLEELGAS